MTSLTWKEIADMDRKQDLGVAVGTAPLAQVAEAISAARRIIKWEEAGIAYAGDVSMIARTFLELHGSAEPLCELLQMAQADKALIAELRQENELLCILVDCAEEKIAEARASATRDDADEKAGITQARVIASEPLSTDAAKEEDRMRRALEKAAADLETIAESHREDANAIRGLLDEEDPDLERELEADIAEERSNTFAGIAANLRAALLPAGEKD